MRRIFVSRCAWSFLASWYSAFSLRSPHSRAVLIRSAISRRATVSSCSSSACSAASPSAVMTTESLKPLSLVLRGKAAPPLAVVADGHQRVRDAGAEHEVAGVARERQCARVPRHVDRRAPALGQDALQELPHGGRLRDDDAETMHGGLHGRRAYTNICSPARLLPGRRAQGDIKSGCTSPARTELARRSPRTGPNFIRFAPMNARARPRRIARHPSPPESSHGAWTLTQWTSATGSLDTPGNSARTWPARGSSCPNAQRPALPSGRP